MSNWDFDEFLGQIRLVKRMGPLTTLLAAISGSAVPQVTGEELEPIERMLEAMTPAERSNPTLLQDSDEAAARRSRIARDSDTTSEQVTALVRQFRAMKRVLARIRRDPFGLTGPSDT